MELLRVFNNNVVLARDDEGIDVIVTGRGLGFQARPGAVIDPAQVARTFVPADGRDPDHLGQLLAEIPTDHIHLIACAMAQAGLDDKASNCPSLVIALADHLGFALKRQSSGLTVTYPLLAEVQHLYPAEAAQAAAVLRALNAELTEPLPDGESVALALHLVNSGFSTGDLSWTYTMTGVIQQMLAVISSSYGIELDPTSVNVGRFITHLRYLFVRIHQHQQLSEDHSVIGQAIRDNYGDAFLCAQRLAEILELRLDATLTDDEVSYLTLHVARVASE